MRKPKASLMALIIVFSILLVLQIPVVFADVNRYVVANDACSSSLQHSYHDNFFYAKSLFWLFYANGSTCNLAVSPNETGWTLSAVRNCTQGWHIVFHHEQHGGIDYIHYAYSPEAVNQPLLYRRGIMNSNGTITWSAEQTVASGDPNYKFAPERISTTSDGYPFIAYTNYSTPTVYCGAFVTKSSANNSTWITDGGNGFPYLLREGSGGYRVPDIVSMGGNYTYATVRVQTNGSIYGRLWNGTSWSSEENVNDFPCGSITMYKLRGSSNEVHLVYIKSGVPYELRYKKRNQLRGEQRK